MKHTVSFLFVLLVSITIGAQEVTINQAQGWLESAFITWQPIEGVDSYNVYYSGEGVENLQIDDQLIRDYGSYFRADILGLKAGTYFISVTAVISEIESEKSTSQSIQVQSMDRTGFSFTNGRVPGAYKADGTQKDNAVVLYVTENTKNTVSLDVTGANTNPCIGLQTILEGFKKGKDSRALIIRVVGQITDPEILDKGDIVIENDNLSTSHITVEGVGNDAVLDGWGIRIKNASNIEIRNIATMNTNSDEGDNIGLQQNNDYIWIHHCDFFYGDAGSDSDQAKGDGALDCKRSTFVTFSYNHFWDTGKSNLLGLSEDTTEGLYITYHHNWYDHSDSRHPRVRFYSAHVYNNYYDGNSKYGVGATSGSSVYVEGNYFRNCKYPILTSMQGSDVYDEGSGTNDYSDKPTFSKEDGGSIKVYDNYMFGAERFVAYADPNFQNSTVDFDGVVVGSASETIPNTITSSYGANIYNNFDTNSNVMYSYLLDSPEMAKTKVMAFSGRMFGGDFKWEFNNAIDDTDYNVNQALKTALQEYTTSLVAVQGDGENSNGDDGETNNPIAGDITHNFTISGLESSYFNMEGNLSDSKGTVYYNDLTLTNCLKIESSTKIQFTTTGEANFIMVFNEDFSQDIKINGIDYTAINGIVNTTLPQGEYEITKADVANLYYMSLTFNSLSATEFEKFNYRIYPNPVSETLYFSSPPEWKSILIYNMLGIPIKMIESGQNVDVSDLSPGNYIFSLSTKERTFNKIFIKK